MDFNEVASEVQGIENDHLKIELQKIAISALNALGFDGAKALEYLENDPDFYKDQFIPE